MLVDEPEVKSEPAEYASIAASSQEWQAQIGNLQGHPASLAIRQELQKRCC